MVSEVQLANPSLKTPASEKLARERAREQEKIYKIGY
jgi:hypothetical protein